MNTTLASQDIHRLLNGEYGDPFGVLGPHNIDGIWVVRAFRPDAKELAIVDRHRADRHFPANRIATEGLFEAQLSGATEAFDYLLQVTTWSGESFQISDPYSYGPILGELDMYLYREGNHYEIYEKLGAHLTEINGHAGVSFAVWAPNAQRVSMVGDFNGWDGRSHPMRKRLESGIWENVIAGVVEETHYKLELRNCFGQVVLKSDPLVFFGQHGNQTASMVFNLDRFKWSDDDWVDARKTKQWHKEAVSIYEVHLGSWARVPEEGNRYLSYIELSDRLIPYVKDLGYTHVELMPVAEHPFDGSWGYQVTGYFAPTSRFGNPDEFRHFVDRCHQNGIGVIVDWVPGHFPKDAHGLALFDGTHLYEHADPRPWRGVSRPPYLGGLGFGLKWNMGWMHDFLLYMSREPIHRRFHQGEATFSMIYAFHEHFILVLSHDEVVHGKGSLLNKMPGDPWQKFANLRMFYAWMYAHPGKKLLFMGGEIGQWKEWNHNESIDWPMFHYHLHDD